MVDFGVVVAIEEIRGEEEGEEQEQETKTRRTRT